MRRLAGGRGVAKPVAVAALGRSGRGVGFLNPTGAGEEGDRVSELGDVGRGYSNHHRGGGLFLPFAWVRLQEPGREDLDAHSIRDGEGECREEVLLVLGHIAPWQAVYGEADLVWGWSEGAVRAV